MLNKLRVEASRSFFEKYGLISHQINSYNDFVENGIQKLFYSIGEIKVEPSYDPTKNRAGHLWKRGRIRFGKVKLGKPMFWTGEKPVVDKEYLKFLPRHARLQRMTYSSRMKVEINNRICSQSKTWVPHLKCPGIFGSTYEHVSLIWGSTKTDILGPPLKCPSWFRVRKP